MRLPPAHLNAEVLPALPRGAAIEDRDSYCTPRWLTTFIGKVDLDPCSNQHATVQATSSFTRGGLEAWAAAPSEQHVYVNPPYSDVTPWVDMAVQRCLVSRDKVLLLLKYDSSTKWYAKLRSVNQAKFPSAKALFFDFTGRISFEADGKYEARAGANFLSTLVWLSPRLQPGEQERLPMAGDRFGHTIQQLREAGVLW